MAAHFTLLQPYGMTRNMIMHLLLEDSDENWEHCYRRAWQALTEGRGETFAIRIVNPGGYEHFLTLAQRYDDESIWFFEIEPGRYEPEWTPVLELDVRS